MQGRASSIWTCCDYRVRSSEVSNALHIGGVDAIAKSVSKEKTSAIQAGQEVLVIKLTSERGSELNGRRGIARRFDEISNRWIVEFQGVGNTNDKSSENTNSNHDIEKNITDSNILTGLLVGMVICIFACAFIRLCTFNICFMFLKNSLKCVIYIPRKMCKLCFSNKVDEEENRDEYDVIN